MQDGWRGVLALTVPSWAQAWGRRLRARPSGRREKAGHGGSGLGPDSRFLPSFLPSRGPQCAPPHTQGTRRRAPCLQGGGAQPQPEATGVVGAPAHPQASPVGPPSSPPPEAPPAVLSAAGTPGSPMEHFGDRAAPATAPDSEHGEGVVGGQPQLPLRPRAQVGRRAPQLLLVPETLRRHQQPKAEAGPRGPRPSWGWRGDVGQRRPELYGGFSLCPEIPRLRTHREDEGRVAEGSGSQMLSVHHANLETNPPPAGRSGTPGLLRSDTSGVGSPAAGRARGGDPGRGAWLGWKKGTAGRVAAGRGSPLNPPPAPATPAQGAGPLGSHLGGTGVWRPWAPLCPVSPAGGQVYVPGYVSRCSACCWCPAPLRTGLQGPEDGHLASTWGLAPGQGRAGGSWPAFCLTLTSLPRPVSP